MKANERTDTFGARWLSRAGLQRTSLICLTFLPVAAFGLSRPIARDIEFPKDYDPEKAAAIRKVIQSDRFEFVTGTVSYWEPDWGTRLSFEGDAAALTEFLAKLRELKGISLRLILYWGRNDELRRDSSWQLDFSHARRNQVTVYVNIKSEKMDFSKVVIPEWPAQ